MREHVATAWLCHSLALSSCSVRAKVSSGNMMASGSSTGAALQREDRADVQLRVGISHERHLDPREAEPLTGGRDHCPDIVEMRVVFG